MSIELTEGFLAKIAGWEAMKQARSLLERGQVLSSNWTPPILKGVVQEGSASYRAGLVIKDSIDLDNICSCRASRQWGTICAHSVAVGLHALHRGNRPDVSAGPNSSANRPSSASGISGPVSRTGFPEKPAKRLRRSGPDQAGEALDVWIILPPNAAQSLTKGKVMLCFEGQWRGGRAPLNALPLQYAWRLSAQDAKLLDRIEEFAGGDVPAMLVLDVADFARLLAALVEHLRITSGKSQSLTVSSEPFRAKIEARLLDSGEVWLTLAGKAPSLVFGESGGEKGRSASANSAWVWEGSKIQPLNLPAPVYEVLKHSVQIPRSRVPQFLSREWPVLAANSEVNANFRLEDFELTPAVPRFFLALSGGLARLSAQLQFRYGPRILTMGVTPDDDSFWLPDPDSVTRYATRDLPAEQAALSRLLRSGFSGPDVRGQYQLLGQDAVLSFFAREYPRMQREWNVTFEERLERSTSQNLERIEPRFEITPSGEQWFDFGVAYSSSSGEKLSAAEIQRLLLSGKNYTRLRNGRLAVIDTGAVEELQEVLLDCAPQQHGGGYRMAATQAGFLESALREHQEWQVHAPAAWRERAARQSGAVPLEIPPLGDLESVMRPYQKEGVAWLHFLRENDFGGILADEMGLGKTLQTLAFIRSVIQPEANKKTLALEPTTNNEQRTTANQEPRTKNQEPRTRNQQHAQVLIVCPTSLVFNWVAEAAKFTPQLRILALQGSQRHNLFSRMPQADVIITSYALIRRDAERYKSVEFDTVVLDEAQHIKNRQTQNAQAVKAIRSKRRLVLTGTPLENSVLDLWSIFDFLMPGYLGSAKEFRERYELPITREKSAEAQARLARRVRPFLLRRLKRDVAADLPEKIEQVTFCDLREEQRAVYRQVMEAGRREVVESVGAQGLGKSRMMIFNALLRLRQICCDLRLLKLEDAEARTASAKLDLFDELLQEALDGGHRVLVFSQFVSMLHLIREKLDANQIEYCYLDGSTTNRGEVVVQFQNNPAIPVFLISLKAGGVGLNLAAADTVIHFDPWWNPAVEDQATDRAHRIGQTRVVTSYKLIARDTVEEKILNLQNRKRAVTAGLLDGDEPFSDSLTWEEIQELFQ